MTRTKDPDCFVMCSTRLVPFCGEPDTLFPLTIALTLQSQGLFLFGDVLFSEMIGSGIYERRPRESTCLDLKAFVPIPKSDFLRPSFALHSRRKP